MAAWLVGGWRWWRPILPAWFRQMPQALAADRRVRRPSSLVEHLSDRPAGRPDP